MLNKSRTNSLARQNYDCAYSVLRVWQGLERRTEEDTAKIEMWRNAWNRNARHFPARAGHLIEAYFWAH